MLAAPRSCQGGLREEGSDGVRVAVGAGPAVLQIPSSSAGGLIANPDAGASVCDTPGECVHGASLVLAGESSLVPRAVSGDVNRVAILEEADGSLNLVHASEPLLSHGSGGVVAVCARSVPVARHGFGIVRDHDVAGQLANALEDVSRHPELVTGVDAYARPNLEFPLAGHDLSVDPRDGQTGIVACSVVGVSDVSSEHPVRTDTAVVGSLRSRIATLGPSEGPARCRVQQSVFLLDAEPRLLARNLREGKDGVRGRTGVGRDGSSARFVGIAHDEEVAAAVEYLGAGRGAPLGFRHGGERRLVQRSMLDVERPVVHGGVFPVVVEYVVFVHRGRPEGVAVYLSRDEYHLGVLARSLVGRRTVVVPSW